MDITTVKEIFYRNKNYTFYHGCPFDRGMADSYYERPKIPNKLSYESNKYLYEESMTKEEIENYYAGYDYNEMMGSKKQ